MWDPKEPLHPAWESHRDRHKRPALQSLHSFGIPRTGIYDELGMESLQLIKTFTNEEKETCKTAKGWFWCCTKNSSHTIIVLLLQYCKLKRTSDESAQEWMGRLQTKVSDCDCNECVRRLTVMHCFCLFRIHLDCFTLRLVLVVMTVNCIYWACTYLPHWDYHLALCSYCPRSEKPLMLLKVYWPKQVCKWNLTNQMKSPSMYALSMPQVYVC